jgi:four helix bundle protein
LAELEETAYWLELLAGSGTIRTTHLTALVQEINELIAILVTCVKNAKSKRKSQ